MALGDHSRSRLKGATDPPICLFCSWQLSPWSLQPADPNGMATLTLSALIFLSEKTFPYALEEAFFLGHRGMSGG